MTGVIDWFDVEKMWGLIARNDCCRRRVFFHVHHCRLDQLGRQRPQAYSIGSSVDFNIVTGRNGEPAAMDVCPYEPFAEPVDLSTHRELSTIVHWVTVHQIGIARRESGDWLAVSHRNVITSGIETLKVGSKIWHGIGFKDDFDPSRPLQEALDPKEVVRAMEIEICVPDSESTALPPAAPVSPLMTPRFRNTPVRQIGVRRKEVAGFTQ